MNRGGDTWRKEVAEKGYTFESWVGQFKDKPFFTTSEAFSLIITTDLGLNSRHCFIIKSEFVLPVK